MADMDVWDHFTQHRYSPTATNAIRHADVVAMLAELRKLRPAAMEIESIGRSAQGREISLVTLGTGEQRVLAWSQMHGNEPTHTAALLDLLHLLQKFPEHPASSKILQGCTLHLIVMLNPDGAEQYTRRNAQGIDVNRDALHMQTPEGRILRDAVQRLSPQFALNLHNQNCHTSVGDPPRPAAVSLLVPPLDVADTQTPGTMTARRMAAVFVESVAERASGMISRYDADFMPRCFGEWVQQQHVATLTLEAGGWSTPHADDSPLVQVHFTGLVGLLERIADGTYQQADPDVYDALPRADGRDLFDVILRDVQIISGENHQPLRGDVAIDFAGIQASPAQARLGTIADLGDLCVSHGIIEQSATDLICVPGRVAYHSQITPNQLPDEKLAEELLRRGVTTVLGTVDLNNTNETAKLAALNRQLLRLPLNVGFLGQVSADCHNATQALAAGVLGLVSVNLSGAAVELPNTFGLPCIAQEKLDFASRRDCSLLELAKEAAEWSALFGWKSRGQITLSAIADLLLLRETDDIDLTAPVDWDALQQVLVAGNVVFDQGVAKPCDAGRLLTRRCDR